MGCPLLDTTLASITTACAEAGGRTAAIATWLSEPQAKPVAYQRAKVFSCEGLSRLRGRKGTRPGSRSSRAKRCRRNLCEGFLVC